MNKNTNQSRDVLRKMYVAQQRSLARELQISRDFTTSNKATENFQMYTGRQHCDF